jgi:hypothetical protein
MAYALADGKKKAQDKLSAEIKIGRISATIFDDMGGLVCVDLLVGSIFQAFLMLSTCKINCFTKSNTFGLFLFR